jgi:uncharacterized membrane-anchored protein
VRAKWVIACFSVVLIVIGMGLIGASTGLLGPWLQSFPMISEWGFTLVSLGGGIAVTYLVVDQLVLREERETWNAVKNQALELIEGELENVFLDLSIITGVMYDPSLQDAYRKGGAESSKGVMLEKMKALTDKKNVGSLQKVVSETRFFQEEIPPMATTLFEVARRLGDLSLRFSTKFLPPKLVVFMNSLEKELLELKKSILGARQMKNHIPLPASTFELQIAYQLVRLIGLTLDAVNDGIFKVPEISFG